MSVCLETSGSRQGKNSGQKKNQDCIIFCIFSFSPFYSHHICCFLTCSITLCPETQRACDAAVTNPAAALGSSPPGFGTTSSAGASASGTPTACPALPVPWLAVRQLCIPCGGTLHGGVKAKEITVSILDLCMQELREKTAEWRALLSWSDLSQTQHLGAKDKKDEETANATAQPSQRGDLRGLRQTREEFGIL